MHTLLQKSLRTLKNEGCIALIKKACRYLQGQYRLRRAASKSVRHDNPEAAVLPSIIEPWIKQTEPIHITAVQRQNYRLNLVTDSISKDSLLGGVATALIVATAYCAKNDMELRIITRCADVEPLAYYHIIDVMGLKKPEKVTFFTDYEHMLGSGREMPLDVSDKDLFLATSWWSAAAIKKIQKRARFFYIIQEVETFFYPHGDAHLFCRQIMEDPSIDFIVNSRYLWDYFKNTCPNICEHGVSFEPAFPESLYHANIVERKTCYKLFFYARPNNPRNLFHTGILILDRAIKEGILDMDKWEICMVGANIPQNIQFTGGTKPVIYDVMSWDRYADFLRTVDLALCLMYTPHPSYPPYDAACSGSVVITNRCLNKTEIKECDNIILGKLTNLDNFMESFEKAVELSTNMEERKRNYKNSQIPRAWSTTISEVVNFMNMTEPIGE